MTSQSFEVPYGANETATVCVTTGHDGHIENIELIHLSPEKKAYFLTFLYNPHVTTYNVPYTTIFKNYCSKYRAHARQEEQVLNEACAHASDNENKLKRLHAQQEKSKAEWTWINHIDDLSDFFIPFESCINQASFKTLGPQDYLNMFISTTLHQYEQDLIQNIQTLKDSYHDHSPALANLLDRAIPRLKARQASFRNLLTCLASSPHLTKDHVLSLMSVQTRAFHVPATSTLVQALRDQNLAALHLPSTGEWVLPSLGEYMAQQMQDILDCGIQGAYEISDQRGFDLLHVPQSVAALSDAKAMITRKAFSLEAAEYNNTYTATPNELLARLTPAAPADQTYTQLPTDQPSDALSMADAPNLSLSLMPYLSHSWDVAELDKVLCSLFSKNLNQRHTLTFKESAYRLSYPFLRWLGLRNGPIEEDETFKNIQAQHTSSFAFGVFSALIVSLFELGIYVPVRLVFTLVLTSFDVLCSTLSLIPSTTLRTGLMSAKEGAYQFHDVIADIHEAYSPILAVKRLWNAAYHRDPMNNTDQYPDLLNFCHHTSNYYHELFDYLSPKHLSIYIQDFFSSLSRSIVHVASDWMYVLSIFPYGTPPEQVYQTVLLRSVLIQNGIQEQPVTQETSSHLQYIPMNHIDSCLAVPVEVMSTLCHVVVDPMFRKSPGPATLYFMLAMATFGTYLLPASALQAAQGVPLMLQKIANAISVQFTGKAIEGSTMTRLFTASIASFLEWKMLFFGTEFAIEVGQGHFDFLGELLKEPEKITLGALGLIATGMCLGLVPHVPDTIPLSKGFPELVNIYAAALNVITEEAHECMFTPGIEQGFLGIKFLMLLQNMSSGTRYKTDSVIDDSQSFLDTLLDNCKDEHLETDATVKTLTTIHIDAFKLALTRTFRTYELAEALQNECEPIFIQTLLLEIIQNPENVRSTALQLNARLDRPVSLPTLTAPSTTPFQHAQQALQDALRLVQSQDPLLFKSGEWRGEAQKMYDHLNHLFDQYNREVHRRTDLSPAEKQKLLMDKAPFLELFYNRYCYQSSNNLLRTLLLVPLPFPPYGVYPIVAGFRLLKLAVAVLLNKPSIIHQVRKSFNKDLVLLFQVIGMFTAVSVAFARAVAYSLRGLIGVPLLCTLGACGYPIAKGLDFFFPSSSATQMLKQGLKTLDRTVCRLFSFHHITPYFHRTAHALYASAARIAGDIGTTEMVRDKAQQLIDDMNLPAPVESTYRSSYTEIQAHLPGEQAPSSDQNNSEQDCITKKIVLDNSSPDPDLLEETNASTVSTKPPH